MFAYCLNNPVNGSDPSGLLPFFVDTILVIKDIYQLVRDDDKRVEAISVSESEVEIKNSSSIKTPIVIALYSEYLAHLSDYKDFFKGSGTGVAFEWTIHNLVFDGARLLNKVGISTGDVQDRAREVNLGATIFCDKHEYQSTAMFVLYSFTSPLTALYDAIVEAWR